MVRKILFSGNWNPLTQKKCLWPWKSVYTSIFPSKHFQKMRERERERARARARGEASDSEIAISPSISRSRSRSRRREIAPDRDRDRDRLSSLMFFSELWLVFFWICVFLLLFQTPKNIFRKIFWNATKHREIFSFSEN